MLEVYVPATSANIGPGYDCLGLCLDLFNKFTFEELESGLLFEGCEEEFANEDNLVYKTMLFFYDKVKPKKIPKGIKITFENNIPICRGLGSSSTCIVAGLMAANVLSEANLGKDEILKLAIELEEMSEDGVFAAVRTNERHNGVCTIVIDIAAFGSVVNEVVYGVGGNIVIIFAFYGHQNVGHFVRDYFLFDNVTGLFVDENAHDSVAVARFDIVEINLIVVAINAVGL